MPGALDNPLSYVPNALLQSGRARAVADFEQIAQALMTNGSKAFKKQKKAQDLTAPPMLSEPLPEVLLAPKKSRKFVVHVLKFGFFRQEFLSYAKKLLEFQLAGRIIKQGAQFVLTGR